MTHLGINLKTISVNLGPDHSSIGFIVDDQYSSVISFSISVRARLITIRMKLHHHYFYLFMKQFHETQHMNRTSN